MKNNILLGIILFVFSCNALKIDNSKSCELIVPTFLKVVNSCNYLPLKEDSITIWKNFKEAGWIFATIDIDSFKLNSRDFKVNSLYELKLSESQFINSLYLYIDTQLNDRPILNLKDLVAISIFIFDKNDRTLKHIFFKKNEGKFSTENKLNVNASVISLNNIYDISTKILKQNNDKSIVCIGKNFNPELEIVKRNKHVLTSAIEKY